MRLDSYLTEQFFDEMFDADGRPRPQAEMLYQRLESLSDGELQRRQTAANLTLNNIGKPFNVNGNASSAFLPH